jgi:hypothetical protein
MRTQASLLSTILIVAMIAAVIPNVAAGQSVWLPPQHGSSFSLEILKPSFAGDAEVSFMTTAWYFAGRYQVSPSVAMIGEIPISHFAPEFGPESETAIGNPYIGVSFEDVNSIAVVEGGIRLPVVSEEKYISLKNGWWADFDRWTAFYPDLLTIKVRAGVKLTGADGKVSGQILIGGSVLAPTNEGDTELMGDLSAGLWFRESQFQFGLDFVGNTLLTADDVEFSSRSEFQFGFGVAGTFGQVRPGIHLQIPLGKDGWIGRGEIVDLVFGINVTVFLPGKYS